MVIRLPSRRRCTSLPSLTARRPKVVSAMSTWRQYCEIWLRIWSFFIRPVLGKPVGSGGSGACPTIICPPLGMMPASMAAALHARRQVFATALVATPAIRPISLSLPSSEIEAIDPRGRALKTRIR
jgi:hypothetical protein